ncbi:MFS transporter [Mycobacteroides sp. LB1]|uniref:MFS transporter n=1 Tax=Mycobacteroides sp. LB1 TaxID=2750814 RepID=UPI0015DE8D03|nr:MFS transporter [Mycobacteroides sp. LB1]
MADVTPLRNPDFRRLWLAGVVTVIGAGLTLFAVPVQIYALTQSSAYVGLTGVFGLVPLVVFGLWGGALADRMDRRTLLIITAVGLGVSSVLLWVQAALSVNNVWVVLCLLSVQQAFFAVNSPTRAAAIPRMLPLDQLPAANALNMTVQQFGFIAGPLLAGILLKWVDLSALYMIDAIACVAPIWATIQLHKMPPSGVSKDARTNGFRDVLDGFRYLAGHKIVLMSFVVDLIAMIFGMPRILFPQIAHEGFGDPADGGTVIALLSAAISAGAVIGGVFSGWFHRIDRQGLAVVVSIVVWGLAMVGFGLTAHAPLLWPALFFLMIGGIADMVSAAFRTTILQSVATDDVRGRLQGVFTVVVAGGPRVADVTHGAVAAVVGTTAAAAGGGALVVVGVVIAALLVPVFVRFRTSSAESPRLLAASDEQRPSDS